MSKYIIIILVFLCGQLNAQSVSGTVHCEHDDPLIGANVYWIDTNLGVATDENGVFEISSKDIDSKGLIATYVGHKPDTVFLNEEDFVEFYLLDESTLEEVIVEGERPGIIISDYTPAKVEQITQTELVKAACCDLSGCFETQTTVKPQTTNVITNSKELRILGLSGVYNQVLVDGFPMIQGLSQTYGISSIPGTLVSNIYVSKGANSVLQGFESISGQINVITKDPEKTDRLFLNLYMNSFLEKQFNANYAFKLGKWNNLTAFQTVQPAGENDRDEDNFYDLPLLTRYMLFNKLVYGNENHKGWHSKINLRFYNENRVGGQTNFDPSKDQGSNTVYGQTVDINQPEISTKTGYRFDEKHHISVFASSFMQHQKAYFGTVKYDADQVNAYANLQYDLNYTEDFNLKSGLSFRYQNLEETVSLESSDTRTYAGDYVKEDVISGVFAENTMRLLDDKLTFIAGIRGDHHNEHGVIFSPRGLLKYDLSPQTIIRANVGSGWRTANLFSENINLLVSSRDVIFVEALEPERAINYGINLTQKFDNESISGVFNVDYYRTDFQNQIFPDYDSDPTKAFIKNFEGESISNGFQTELILKTWDVLEWKVGYNYLDVYREADGEKIQLPFNSKHKLLGTFSFKPKSRKYHLDINAHWFGKQRLPDTQLNPVEFRRPDESEAYATLNAQFTYSFTRFDIYAGCENIFDFRQERPILSWEDPFGPYFDTALVWGPTKGREFYLGVRYSLPK